MARDTLTRFTRHPVESEAGFVGDVSQQVRAVPGGQVLLAADTGKAFSNDGATGRADFSLPAAAVGLEFTFLCADADGIRVIAATGDDISIGASTSASGGRIDSTAPYSAVHLKAINATHWAAVSSTGTWAVN